jgi:hypothetical protein
MGEMIQEEKECVGHGGEDQLGKKNPRKDKG